MAVCVRLCARGDLFSSGKVRICVVIGAVVKYLSGIL